MNNVALASATELISFVWNLLFITRRWEISYGLHCTIQNMATFPKDRVQWECLRKALSSISSKVFISLLLFLHFFISGMGSWIFFGKKMGSWIMSRYFIHRDEIIICVGLMKPYLIWVALHWDVRRPWNTKKGYYGNWWFKPYVINPRYTEQPVYLVFSSFELHSRTGASRGCTQQIVGEPCKNLHVLHSYSLSLIIFARGVFVDLALFSTICLSELLWFVLNLA